MTPAYNRMLMTANPCADAPTLGTVTASQVSFNNCTGGSNGWRTNATVGITGSLQPGQEYVWEHQANQSGTWAELGRSSSTTSPTRADTIIGANGLGSSTTKYSQFRVWVVPIGAATSAACRGPATSNELSKTANLCVF